MTNSPLRLAAALLAASVLAFPAAAGAEGEESGFLADYTALTEVKDPTGETVLRYVNPDIKPGAYHAVRVDPVVYFPSPRPTEQVSAQALLEIAEYLDKGLRAALSRKVRVVSESGPGVGRIRPAITAVAPKSPGLKPYELIPIGFLISSARGRGKEATIQIEVQVLDSVTGERLGASVRKGAGVKLASDDAALELKHVQPLLDKWIEAGAAFMGERLE